MLCIGHRGAMGHAPENTLRSVSLALEMGCTWVEVDVHTVESELIVIHDFSLERTTSGRGLVAEQSLKYLRSLDAGGGERIPLLREVFDVAAGRAGVNIELKGRLTAAPVAAFLRERLSKDWEPSAVLVSSFDHAELAEFKTLLPEVPIGALIEREPSDLAASAERLGAYSLNPSLKIVSPELVSDARQRGLKVFVYTVNRQPDIQRMRELGVDGVFTNFPERVLEPGR